jgi:hypothetical protein
VILSRAGRVQSLPFTTLSREDRQYVRDLLVLRGEGALAAQLPTDESPANFGPAIEASPPQAPPGFTADTGPGPAGNAPPIQPTGVPAPETNSVPARQTSGPPEASPPPIIASIPNPTVETSGQQAAAGRKPAREINIAALVIGLPIGAAIGSLIGAIILRAATYFVLGEHIPYGHAYGTAFIAYLVTGVVGFVIGFGVGAITQSEDSVRVAQLIAAPVNFLILSAIISGRLDTGFGSACLIALMMFVISIVIAVVIIVMFLAVFGGIGALSGG